jgi:anti-sigma factor RsiW
MSLDDPDLAALIRRHATRHTAPAALRASVRTQIALADAGRVEPVAPEEGALRRGFAFTWRSATVGFALGVASAWLVLPALQRLESNEPVDAELVSEHVQALKAGRLFEVASSDRHVVKPWFQGRLDYAPPVFDLGAEGFPLTGGRVDHVRGSPLATLAYARNRHVIDVFILPGRSHQAPVRSVHRGFNVMHWADGSMQYWAVSDLERAELERFAQLCMERATAQ